MGGVCAQWRVASATSHTLVRRMPTHCMPTDDDVVRDFIKRLDQGEIDGTLNLDKLSDFQLLRVMQILAGRVEEQE